jgi:KDO2-lipid IV(A) lauroyltransferase
MLTFIVFKIASLIVPHLPMRFGYGLTAWVATISYWILPGPRNGIKGNLRQALGPEVDEKEISRLARQCFQSGAKNYYDLFRIPVLSLEELEKTVKVDGWDILHDALADGKGAIVFSAHLGNLELISQIIVAHNMKAVIPVEHVKPECLFKLVTGARSSRGLKMIPTDGGALREIYRALRQNCIVGMGADRAVQGTGIWTEFFGRETIMPDAPAVLALRTGAKALPVRSIRQPDNSFEVKVYPPLDFVSTTDAHQDVRINTEKVVKIMEGFIRENPEQWVVFEPMWQDGTEYAKRAKNRARATAR